jgi:hypothetical protein
VSTALHRESGMRISPMNEIEWLGDKLFRVDGVEFLCTLDTSLKTTDQRIVIVKDRLVLDNYDTVFSGSPPDDA